VVAALLLMAAFAAAPVNAQEAGGGVAVITPEAPPTTTTTEPLPPTDPPPPPPSDSNPTPPTDPPPPPPSDSNPTPPPTTDPPVSEPGSDGGPPGPADNGTANGTGGGTDTRPLPQDQFTSAMAGPGTSAAAPSSSSSGSDTELTGASGGGDTWLGQDTFVVGKATGAVEDDAAVPTIRGRLGGMLLVGATSHAKQIEAEARQSHEMAQATAIGSGPPGTGIPLPGDNPFFNLLSGPGGIAAGMMLASMLAVLGAAFLLPRDRLRAFRMPTVTWRPLAYVPPIELPG
jgi:hypothetical protein